MKLLHTLEEKEVIHAIEGSVLEIYKLFSKGPKMEVNTSEKMIWSLTDIPFFLFNIVFRSNFKKEEAEQVIETTLDKCRVRNVPLLWQLGPNAQPADLGAILEKHGFLNSGSSPGMAVDIRKMRDKPAVLKGFEVRRVSGFEMLKTYLDLVKRAFDMPDVAIQAMAEFFNFIGYGEDLPLQHFLGVFNGEPVATSMVILGGGVAGILDIATLPEVRRQGIGSFMTSNALQFAMKRGYSIGVLTSSEEGLKVYEKLGFREFCKINNYIWSPPSL